MKLTEEHKAILSDLIYTAASRVDKSTESKTCRHLAYKLIENAQGSLLMLPSATRKAVIESLQASDKAFDYMGIPSEEEQKVLEKLGPAAPAVFEFLARVSNLSEAP